MALPASLASCSALWLRSALFNICFMFLTALFSTLLIISRIFGFDAAWFWARAWSRSIFWLLRRLCHIDIKVEGKEHMPEQACVVMAKHQSAAETIAMPLLMPPYAWILKRELYYIPLFGWALKALGAIAIRRGNPREAIKQVIRQGKSFLLQNRWVIIFPEGTRSAAGETGNYQPGGVVLAQQAGVGILPVAHNAGLCWPKHGFIKRPGVITFRFLPLIPAEEVISSKRNALLERLKNAIESATREAGG
jgi:1-acyl-sn-glycerol-3-phosphate acyltransferase